MQLPTECPTRGSLNKRGLSFHKTKGLEVTVVVGIGSVIQNVNAAIPCDSLGLFPHGHKCCSMHPSPRQEEGKGREKSSSFEALSFCSEREVSPCGIPHISLPCMPILRPISN